MLDYYVPELFYSEDTIYHYTSLKTALDYILKDGTLKFSPMIKSKDPLEVSSLSGFTSFNEDFRGPKLQQICNGVKHLCFCRNRGGSLDQNTCSIGDLGFVFPRMWDQYGDHFQGVCLAFSKKRLSMANPNITWREREYLSFEKMEEVKNSDFGR